MDDTAPEHELVGLFQIFQNDVDLPLSEPGQRRLTRVRVELLMERFNAKLCIIVVIIVVVTIVVHGAQRAPQRRQNLLM